jgi:hypothetical protein
MSSLDLSMFPTGAFPLVTLIGVSAALLGYFALSTRKQTPNLPPGPPAKWLIGNALDVPFEQEWVGWERLKRKYGPIVTLKVFGELIVTLNDPDLIVKLFEKRSSVASGRPIFVLAGQMYLRSEMHVTYTP